MKAYEVFNKTMSLIDERNPNGTLDETAVAEYRAKTPDILTILQAEIIGIQNRYKEYQEYVVPVPIINLEQDVQMDDIEAITLLTNGLAAHLMTVENQMLADFYQQRYEELKGAYLKPKPSKQTKREDIYDSTLSY